ncbi:Ammonium transporter 2 [Diplonema papillatum]|nr:Ammonium transporter 2 [Diplonema papillatum]
MYNCTVGNTQCEALFQEYDVLAARKQVSESAYDTFWILLATILVFLMQSGFAMLEAGTVRRMNVSNILFKNAFDPVIAALTWWICGYAFAFGIDEDGVGGGTLNAFIGNGDFFFTSDGHVEGNYILFLFQWAFCATAATIVSGAIAERCYIVAYFAYSTLLCSLVYPIVVHWVWSTEGWLSPFNSRFDRLNHGMIDFAGSGVVHMLGGFSALAGAFVVGPRLGWVDNKEKLAAATTVEERRQAEAVFAPHDKTLMALGTLILWFGWFGFNCGSTVALSGGMAEVAGKVGINTVLGAAGGGLGIMLITVITDPEHRLLLDPVFNGILGGLVSVTAPCATVDPWAAVVIGLLGSGVYFCSANLVTKLNIDDVLDAAAVHGFCGYWGIIAAGIFSTKSNLAKVYGAEGDVLDDMAGFLYGGNGKQFGTQLLGGLVIFVWAFTLSFLLFFGLKLAGHLRVPEWTEMFGLDSEEHGAEAFSKSFHWAGQVEMKERVKEQPAPLTPPQAEADAEATAEPDAEAEK